MAKVRFTRIKSGFARIWWIVMIGMIGAVMMRGSIRAQVPEFNIAQTIQIQETEAVGGDIMSLDEEKGTLVRSKVYGDAKMYGVLVSKPQIVYRTLDTIPISRSGNAMVNITTLGGTIKRGDFITSSPIVGKGQKAENSGGGYMVGVALAPYDGKEGQAITHNGKQYQSGQVLVAVGIGPTSPALIKAIGGILGTLRQITSSILYNIGATRQFEKLIRYLIAALIALLVIYISYRTFGKNITKGIEAIGRNPLAKSSIQAMIIVNVILIFIVSLGGILLSLAIISL